jgi:mRNA interferase HigB
MRIIKRKTLSDYWEKHKDLKSALQSWYAEAKAADWKTPNEILARFPYADPVGENRVVFNLKGNHYRLVVKIHYKTGIVFIRFIGTHADYDKIDAENI